MCLSQMAYFFGEADSEAMVVGPLVVSGCTWHKKVAS